jgi:hypothetical protein
MAKNDNVRHFTKDIADAIRTKTGEEGLINPQDFTSKILDISTGDYNVDQIIDGDLCELHITTADGSKRYLCEAIDYDGTILKREMLPEGGEFVLPELPTHDKLIAQGWGSAVPINDGKIVVDKRGVLAGAVYVTKSGLTEIDVDTASGLMVVTNFEGERDWGDGVVDSLNFHTYAEHGEYTITCDVEEFVAKDQTMGVLNQSLDAECLYCTAIRFGSKVTKIGDIDYMTYLRYITIPESVTTITQTNTLYILSGLNGPLLTSCIIPNTVTTLTCNIACGDNLVLSSGVKTIDGIINTTGRRLILPNVESVTGSITAKCIEELVVPEGTKTLSDIRSSVLERLDLPDSLQSIGTISSYFLKEIKYPSGMTSAAGVIDCLKLKSLVLPSGTTVLSSNFENLQSLTEFVIPEGVTRLPNSFLHNSYSLTKLVFPPVLINSSVSIGAGDIRPVDFVFTKCTSVPTLSISFPRNKYNRIIVPDALYDEWIAASNWSRYVKNIYKESEANL